MKKGTRLGLTLIARFRSEATTFGRLLCVQGPVLDGLFAHSV